MSLAKKNSSEGLPKKSLSLAKTLSLFCIKFGQKSWKGLAAKRAMFQLLLVRIDLKKHQLEANLNYKILHTIVSVNRSKQTPIRS